MGFPKESCVDSENLLRKLCERKILCQNIPMTEFGSNAVTFQKQNIISPFAKCQNRGNIPLELLSCSSCRRWNISSWGRRRCRRSFGPTSGLCARRSVRSGREFVARRGTVGGGIIIPTCSRSCFNVIAFILATHDFPFRSTVRWSPCI